MKIGYEQVNSSTNRIEKIIDRSIDNFDDAMARLEVLKSQYADNDSIISVFIANEVNESKYKIIYIDSI